MMTISVAPRPAILGCNAVHQLDHDLISVVAIGHHHRTLTAFLVSNKQIAISLICTAMGKVAHPFRPADLHSRSGK